MYLTKGELNGVRFLSQTTVNSIMSDQLGAIWDGNKHYGLAFGLINEKGAAAGGEGGAGTFDRSGKRPNGLEVSTNGICCCG